MPEAYYRVGQAAKLLGISSYHLRRLCELGIIEAEFSGHQWRVLVSAMEAMLETGVPPIPSGEIVPHGSNGSSRRAKGLLGPPSDDAASSAEEALKSEHEVTIARNRAERLESQVKSLSLEREIAEQQDRSREREAQKAERLAQAQAEKRRKQAEAEAEEERRFWRSRWMRFAMDRLNRIAPDAPPEIRQAAVDAVEETLGELGPEDAEKETRYKMELTVDGAMRVWQRRQDSQKAVESALERLPRFQRPEMDGLHEQAERAAAQAVAELDEDAAYREMETAAARAMRPMREKMEHIERCHRCADGIFLMRGDARGTATSHPRSSGRATPTADGLLRFRDAASAGRRGRPPPARHTGAAGEREGRGDAGERPQSHVVHSRAARGILAPLPGRDPRRLRQAACGRFAASDGASAGRSHLAPSSGARTRRGEERRSERRADRDRPKTVSFGTGADEMAIRRTARWTSRAGNLARRPRRAGARTYRRRNARASHADPATTHTAGSRWAMTRPLPATPWMRRLNGTVRQIVRREVKAVER